MVNQRPENTDLLVRITAIEQVLAFLLEENPPPPDTMEILRGRIETYFNGPNFTEWDETTRRRALYQARIALITIFRPPHRLRR